MFVVLCFVLRIFFGGGGHNIFIFYLTLRWAKSFDLAVKVKDQSTDPMFADVRVQWE